MQMLSEELDLFDFSLPGMAEIDLELEGVRQGKQEQSERATMSSLAGSTAVFETPHAALTFAFRFSMAQYGESLLAKMQGGRRSVSGKGLVGLDGAAQAGMVLAEIERLHPSHRAIIVARFSPRFEPCPCCGGEKPLAQWQEAVEHLAWACVPTGVSNHRVCRSLVTKWFGAKGIDFVTLAEHHNLHRKTVAEYYRIISRKLNDIESCAQTVLYGALGDSGMVAR